MISTEKMQRDADELATIEVEIETNEGTYSAVEAVRACGSGDPAFADYHIFERVGDATRRRTGCTTDRSPGRARRVGTTELADRRNELADLRRQIRDE